MSKGKVTGSQSAKIYWRRSSGWREFAPLSRDHGLVVLYIHKKITSKQTWLNSNRPVIQPSLTYVHINMSDDCSQRLTSDTGWHSSVSARQCNILSLKVSSFKSTRRQRSSQCTCLKPGVIIDISVAVMCSRRTHDQPGYCILHSGYSCWYM